MKCHCKDCNGKGVIECPDCDGTGKAEICILDATLDKDGPHYLELSMLREQAEIAKEEGRDRIAKDPGKWRSHHGYFRSTLSTINRKADAINARKL